MWREFKAKLLVCCAGSILLILSAPVLAIAFLAIAYLIISGEDQLPEYVISTYFPYLCTGLIEFNLYTLSV